MPGNGVTRWLWLLSLMVLAGCGEGSRGYVDYADLGSVFDVRDAEPTPEAVASHAEQQLTDGDAGTDTVSSTRAETGTVATEGTGVIAATGQQTGKLATAERTPNESAIENTSSDSASATVGGGGSLSPVPAPSNAAPSATASSETSPSDAVSSQQTLTPSSSNVTQAGAVRDNTGEETEVVVKTSATAMESRTGGKTDAEAVAPQKNSANESATKSPSAVDAAAENSAPAEPLPIKLLIPEKTFRPESAGKAIRLSYDDIDLLKILNMEPVPPDAPKHFPGWLNELDGKRIRIRGFMYPTFEATGLEAFTMARDNGICCFVRQPKIYDIIAIRLAKGETTDYIEGKPFDVEGTFRIAPEADETELFQLYRVEDAVVIR
ncbi:MAG: hypothetical protein KDA89_21040 [Planctomycetaceae bacterium]|nr:hypothetical protein [Planctomycetaceae bacterium]